jgi:hypothetical protein
MFSIHWLRGRSLVEQQTSELNLLADVIAVARGSVREIGARHPGNSPETFKVFDQRGRELGHYTLLSP